MNSAVKFHKERVAFAIVNGEVLYLKNSELSHMGWLVGGGIVKVDKYPKIVRGYYRDGILAFYRGDFKGDLKVERTALEYAERIMQDLGIEEIKSIYCGVVEGEIGEIWKPVKELVLPQLISEDVWQFMSGERMIEETVKFLDAVRNNYLLLNLNLLRENRRGLEVPKDMIKALNVAKSRVRKLKDNEYFVEDVEDLMVRISLVKEMLLIFLGE